MTTISGAPKFSYQIITNQTNLPSNPIGGRGALMVRAKRGEEGKVFFCSSRQDFLRNFGGDSDTELDATYAMIMLDAGAKLYISRAVHYTDATDISTVEGTKATATATVSTDVANFEAKSVGEGYNGTTIAIAAASSGTAGRVDITINVPEAADGDEQIIRDVPNAPTAAQIADFNKRAKHINLLTVTGVIPVTTATLASGAEDRTLVDVNDYAGDKAAGTGLHAFDSTKEAFRIANIFPDPLTDDAFAAYIVGRNYDMKLDLGVPLGISLSSYSDYQTRAGAYAGQGSQINNYAGAYVGGELEIQDPRDLTLTLTIPGIVAAFPNKLDKDRTGRPWLSAAIVPEFGSIKTPNNGVVKDLATQANLDTFDTLSTQGGFNCISQSDNYGARYYGNDSTLIDRSNLLAQENIADLIVYITRELPKYLADSQFRPNDPQMWRQTYLRVRPFITQTLVAGRAIRPVENRDWFWIGDQDVQDFRSAEFNRLVDIDRGLYKVRFVFVPIAAAKYIALDIIPTNSENVLNVVVRDDLI